MALQVEYTTEILYRFNGDDMEEVNQETSGPGSIADIWKKFELIPTPPLSPSRQTTSSGASSPICFTTSPADTLQNVSDILDVDNSRTTAYFTSLFGDPGGVNPNLIQDCMWGSHSATDKKNGSHLVEEIYETPCATPPSLLTLDYVSSECVDPTSVFPYHINHNAFPSDSSDEDEIDVVSVEKPVVLKRKTSSSTDTIKSQVDTDKVTTGNNSSGCTSNDEDNTDSTEPSHKKSRTMTRRLRNNVNNKGDHQVLSKEISRRLSAKDNNNNNNNTTKQEDPECKRTVHNVLERKRRNDLKYSFQVLRDSVPELTGSERAPKVAILKKATDCIESLKSQEHTLLKQKENLQKRNAVLVRKLKALEEKQFSANTPTV